MALRNISASILRAAICSFPERESGELGDRLDSAWMSLVAATAVTSAEDRRKQFYCAGDALSACFRNVSVVASVVVGSVAYTPAINCMGGPGESFVW